MLSRIFPHNVLDEPERGIQEVMRAVIMRPNFIPGTRYRIGWRGLKESSVTDRHIAWTARVGELPGLVGLAFDHYLEKEPWVLGRFLLYYFPSIEEDRVEGCSIAALALIEQKDYIAKVRDFLLYPEFSHHFFTGTVTLSLHRAGNGISLGLESLSRQRTIALDGISVSRNGEEVFLVEPGGFDMDFPAFETVLAFYEVLAASLTFSLEEPPVVMEKRTTRGNRWVYDRTGHFEVQPSPDANKENFILLWGGPKVDGALRILMPEETAILKRISWKQGMSIPAAFDDRKWWTAHLEKDAISVDKKILGMANRPDLIVLTGFLGSGKTTFLQRFIEYEVQKNQFVAVLQNEIGEIGLDGKLLDHDYAVTEIDEGCVCCSLAGSMKRGLHEILGRFHPDIIILETTGLANPKNLKEELIEVRDIVNLDSIATIVDGPNIEEVLKQYEVAREQIEAADILLLNKVDLLTSEKVSELKDTLCKMNPWAPVFPVRYGDVNPSLLFGPNLRSVRMAGKQERKEDLSLQPHYKKHSHETDELSSLKISLLGPVDRESFIDYLDGLPPSVFRIKGIIDFRQDDGSSLLQYVAGRYEIMPFTHPSLEERFLIFIGRDLDKISMPFLSGRLL